uniref:Venom s1 protease 46 n=1 Tax=Pristhesancus plagipennis TaxID=1955184 RepID=A0A1Q1NPI5_PRIPG|nr:venom s1 protease 46 [Pristhesancus plagipennis]
MLKRILLFLLEVCFLIDGILSIEEVVKLTTPGIGKTLQLPEGRLPNYDHTWIIESTPGTKISFKCELVLLGSRSGCDENSFTFNDGENEEKFCMYQNFILFSRKNQGKIRIKLDEKGIGRMHCLVQSITGPHANEYENVASAEVDSSEHGVTAAGRKTSCKCGWANKGSSSRIMHGKEARVNEFPWLVHLHILHEFGPIRYATSCGASILTPRHVLTAAHCVVAQNTRFIAKPNNLIMVLAEHDTREKNNDKRMITGEKIFVRDLYLDKGLEYDDIAIIFTKETIQFNDIIGPICLEPKPFSLLHKSLTIMGWGMTEEGAPSPYVRKAKVRVMDTSICGMKPWDICTSTMPSSLCVGDSGGPLVYLDPETNRYSQVALVSKVRPDCKGEASASTSTSYYYDWIQEVIKETDSSYATCHKV